MRAKVYTLCAALLLTLGLTADAARPAPVALAKRLEQLRFPEIKFREANLPDVLQFLSKETHRVHKQHVNFVLINPSGQSRPITLNLRNVPLDEVVKYVAELAGLRYRVEKYAVVLTARDGAPQRLETRIYPVHGSVVRMLTGEEAFEPRLQRSEDY